jgi:hypothetical protein
MIGNSRRQRSRPLIRTCVYPLLGFPLGGRASTHCRHRPGGGYWRNVSQGRCPKDCQRRSPTHRGHAARDAIGRLADGRFCIAGRKLWSDLPRNAISTVLVGPLPQAPSGLVVCLQDRPSRTQSGIQAPSISINLIQYQSFKLAARRPGYPAPRVGLAVLQQREAAASPNAEVG